MQPSRVVWLEPLPGPGRGRGRAVVSVICRVLGWLLGLPPVRTPRVCAVRDLEIPAGDGVVLLADRYYPVGQDSAPLVLIRTPYGRRSANILIARLFAERGYQVLIQALRGTDGSGGLFNGFVMERGDGPATIAWLREQDWFPGVFATWGASYLGYAQWDLASTAIAEWTAAMIDVAPADFYHHFMYPGGAFAIGNALGWAQLVHNLFRHRRGAIASTMSALLSTGRLARACDRLPIADADTIATGARVPYYRDWITHETYDDYWAQMDYRAYAANLPPIVHLGAGWADFFLPDVVDNYARLDTAGRTVRLLIGSGAHGRNMAIRAYQRDTFALLDSVFGHVDAAESREPAAVRLRITGRPHTAQLDEAAAFTAPEQVNHRRYEALRAYFVDGLSHAEAGDRFGYTGWAMVNLVRDYRNGKLNLFAPPRKPGRVPGTAPAKDRVRGG
jgi:uncharacterized protein